LGVFVGLVVLAAVAYVIIALVRTVPALTVMPVPLSSAFPGPPPALAWPGQGEAAAGVQGVGVIGVHGSDRPTPIASLAKVMTAYIVLRDHPLGTAGNGPEISVTPADVAVYRSDLASGQSVVAVRAGERLTERQALEGLLLPSGNNIASLLARWDAGSEAAFLAKVNAQARALGLAHTRYTDSSGVQAGTVSTAGDQVRLAMLALNFPAFAQIVAMPQVTLPVAGLQYNVDALLGSDGIVGIKTGSTSQAGGCFVFAAHELVGGRTVTLAGAVLHQLATSSQPSIIAAAFTASTSLITSVRRALVRLTVVRRGATLAWVEAPWGGRVALRAAASASLVGWPGLPLRARIAPSRHPAAPLEAGQSLGTVVVAGGEHRAAVRLATSAALPGPSLSWRLAHP
jgi:serine-type D-Ala-D-Ala carboxypeptidase (penicillin-binding protein 5/6)